MEDDAALHLVDARDGETFLVGLRIATADQHHTHCAAGVELDGLLAQRLGGHALQQFHQVTLDAEHHTLGLWVAHAYIIFYDLGVALYIDETEEDESPVVDMLGGQTFHGGTYDAVLDLLHPGFIRKGNGTDRTHATGVQTRVMLTDALVVLGLRQDDIVLAVGKHEDAALYAAHELLDDHSAAGTSKHTAQHLLQFLLGLFQRGEDEYSLSGTQTIGFQDVRSLQCPEEGLAFGECLAGEGLVGSRGNMVALHEALGKVLAALQHGTLTGGTDDGNILQSLIGLEIIVDSLHQGVFGTYHDHVDALGEDKGLDAFEIIGLEGYVLTHTLGSGIAGSNKKAFYLGTLAYLPGKGMFAPA